jgi:ribonuclease HI
VNTDGAFRKEVFNGGGGVVMRDHHGGFIAGACRFFPNVVDPECAELLACREGLLLAKEKQMPKVILETDNLSVRAKLTNGLLDRSIYGALVEDLKELLSRFEESSISVVRHSANGAAHILAKDGCENKINRIWLGVPAASIVNSIVSDVSVN